MKKTRKKRATYSEAVASEVLERIAVGESLRAIGQDEAMPSRATILRWVLEDVKGFRARYAHAIDFRAYIMAGEILDLADSAKDQATGSPGTGEASAKVQAIKLQVESRKWLLTKLLPKKYGDRVAMEHSGPDGEPIETKSELILTPEDEAFLARKSAILLRLERENAERKAGAQEGDTAAE